MNHNIPRFKCKVKKFWFTKNESDTELWDCYVFAIQSIPGKVLTFHIMTDFGALRSRVPINQLRFEPGEELPVHFLQLWDCFSIDCEVVEYDYLSGKRCQVLLKDKRWIWTTYMFTLDWYNNAYSEEPTDYKCGHLLKGDNGQLFLQPNNRIKWSDMNWITKQFPVDPKEMKVDTSTISVESFSDRWISEDTSSFYYDIVDLST